MGPDGIQVLVCAPSIAAMLLLEEFRSLPGLSDLTFNIHESSHQPFSRMIIRILRSLEWKEDMGAELEKDFANSLTPILAKDMPARIAHRHRWIQHATHPLPGSATSDQFKPVNIGQAWEGRTLLDVLCATVPHITRTAWQNEFAAGLLLNPKSESVGAGQLVRAGESYRHLFRRVLEPDVDGRVEILHEDEALVVVNKPAPLPMHAGGRFYRNTLQHILDTVYAPEHMRPAHRLDANTTGLVLVTRSQLFAGRLQSQFARREIRKQYLVRVQGHPSTDHFTSNAPISAVSGPLGSRQIDPTSGREALTEFRVIERSVDGTSLLEARPLTGRTNQIRVHLWDLGFPVRGDQVYLADRRLGDTQTVKLSDPPLCLHAWRITFSHPLTQQPTDFTAAPPPWARKISS